MSIAIQKSRKSRKRCRDWPVFLKKVNVSLAECADTEQFKIEGKSGFFSAILQLKSEELRLIPGPIAPQAKNLTNFFN